MRVLVLLGCKFQAPKDVCEKMPLSHHKKEYLWIQKPTVLGVLPSNQGVITYYFVGFGDTGKP